jgi:putative effector of murein hydrolase
LSARYKTALTAVLIIATVILGAQSVTPLIKAPKLNNYAARCFAVGLTSRGCGTAKAWQRRFMSISLPARS